MINLYLEALTLGEKFALSGEMLLRGMGTVFMVLIILWGILVIFGKIFAGTGKMTAEQKPENVQNAQNAQDTPSNNKPEVTVTSDDGALIAAITAAIEAYRNENGTGNTAFHVVSFRQKKSAGGWMGNDISN